MRKVLESVEWAFGSLCNILHASICNHLKVLSQQIYVCVPLMNSNTYLYGSVTSDHFSLPPCTIKYLRYSRFQTLTFYTSATKRNLDLVWKIAEFRTHCGPVLACL